MKYTSYDAPHYAIFSSTLLLPPSWVQIFSSPPCSKTFNLHSSLTVRDQVSHPYKTRGKIIVLHILIFRFLERRREERFWN
jgi:hypothetical protein